MKYSDKIFYYPSKKGFWRGSHAPTLYIFRGSTGQVLIDPGTAVAGTGKKYLAQMAADGIDIEATTLVCLTHPHPDHVRGVNFFQEQFPDPLPVWVHPGAVQYLQDYDSYKRILFQGMVVEGVGDMRKALGVPPTRFVEIGFNFLYGKPQSITGLQAIPFDENPKLDFGGSSFEAVETPGHVPEHVAYLVDDQYLFSGDLISFQENRGETIGLGSINNPLSDWNQEMATLKQLYEQSPEVLLSGHYGVYEGREKIQGYFGQAIETLQALLDRTLETIQNHPDGLTLKDLIPQVFTMEHYLVGVKTKESSLFVILRKLYHEDLITPKKKKKEFLWVSTGS